MNWNYFYRTLCPEFKQIKNKIWEYNNYIPPLPKNKHPSAICLIDSILSNNNYSDGYIERCDKCLFIVAIGIMNEKHDFEHIIKKYTICKTYGVICRTCHDVYCFRGSYSSCRWQYYSRPLKWY